MPRYERYDASRAIQAEQLVREFKKGPRAVDGIDLAVAPGEIYGFLGPNGAGKSTTVHMLTTLLPPTSGTARVAGFDVVRDGPKVRAHIGAALQEAALDPLLTGREHLRLQASLQALPRADRARRADELLGRVGLARGRRPQGARLLGRDEAPARPRAGARPPARASSSSTSRRRASTSRAGRRSGPRSSRLAKDEGVTVFLTTQYLEEADVLADRVGIIDHGHIVAEGTPARPQGGGRAPDGRGDSRRSRPTWTGRLGRARAVRRARPLRGRTASRCA